MLENSFKKFISLNITYLCDVNNLTQNELGALFGLGRSVVSHYVSQKTTPRLDTIIEICKHFNISIDNFLTRDLATLPKTQGDIEVSEGDCKMCALYENIIEDKERIIKSLERENAALRGLDFPDESQTA